MRLLARASVLLFLILSGLVPMGVLAEDYLSQGGLPELEDINEEAMVFLNTRRQAYHLPPVQGNASLAGRCYEWLMYMTQLGGLKHDPKVYGTPERENLAGGVGFPMTIAQAMRMWERSPPHAASMFDRGFPRAVYGGYAQYKGFACLRLCPRLESPGHACSETHFVAP
jgi:hypothetical protein